MSSVLLKKGIHALRSNSLNNSLTKFFLSTEKELKSNNNNNYSHKVYENRKISFTERIQFFDSKSIEYNHGWNNTSLLICSKSMNFFLNNETGIFVLLFGLPNICSFFSHKSY